MSKITCPMCGQDEDCGSLLHPDGAAIGPMQDEIEAEMESVRRYAEGEHEAANGDPDGSVAGGDV